MKNIAKERERKGITQSELADEMGVSRATVNRWENGITNPSASDVKVMADFFGCSADYLTSTLKA